MAHSVSLQTRLIAGVSIAWLLVILFGLTLSYRFEGQSIWLSWEQRPGGWCEHDRKTEFVRERSNSWSDVSYLFLGLWMISQGIFDQMAMTKSKYLLPEFDKSLHQELMYEQLIKCNTLVAIPVLSMIIGFYNVVHAFGTFWYHACACFHGHNLDAAGMLTVSSFPFVYVLFCRWANSQKNLSKDFPASGGYIYGGIMTILFLIYYTLSVLHLLPNFEMEMLMVFVITTDLACLYWFTQDTVHILQYNYLWTTVACFAIGLVFQKLDKANIFCFPNHIIQGHAVWHVMTCVAIYCVFMFFRTAKPSKSKTG